MTTCLSRFEGRLFAEGGCLFLVVHVDQATGIGRVSCSIDGEMQVTELPLAEISRRVSEGAQLILDNLNGPLAAQRLLRRKSGWHFASREGEMGPFPSKQEAGQQLARYILSKQSQGGSRRGPSRSGLRREDLPAAQQPA
jgi:hypothetical protein